MSRIVMVSRELNDPDSGLQPGLTCHVEIENEIGTAEEIDASTAQALRDLAAQIETGKLESGFHDIKTPSGVKIGEVYLAYHASGEA